MRTVVLGPGERLKPAQLTRKGVLPADVVSAARDIVATVRAEGDAALSRGRVPLCRRGQGGGRARRRHHGED